MRANIETITTTEALHAFCTRAHDVEFVTVDTEFLREKTYYAQLCLVQMALAGASGNDDAVLIDVLSPALSLDPLLDVFRNEKVVKVFHAARQDLEIFALSYDTIPKPVFDTQVAAMVCGFGDQVGYDSLVRALKKVQIDKSSRFTDWSRRPLSADQTSYALADVTHLRDIYGILKQNLDETGRVEWVHEDLIALEDPALYRTDPEEMWRKIKSRNASPKFLNVVQKLAAFRERTAQEKDVPRSRLFKDDALLELAAVRPKDEHMLQKTRLVPKEVRRGALMHGVLDAIATAQATPERDFPRKERPDQQKQVNPALSEMLRVLLNVCSAQSQVAPKLLASAHDLSILASGAREVPAMEGWRYGVFGKYAEKLCAGELALGVDGEEICFIEVKK